MPKGYTFDSSHGPGVSSSSAGSYGSSSISKSGSSGSSSTVSKISNAMQNVARSVSNAASTNPSLLGERIREVLTNPATSAQSANMYDSYLSQYGLGFDMDEYYDKMMQMAQANNDWSALQAQKQMDFESAMANRSMAFEAAQAEKQMQYQTRSDQAAMAWSAQEAAKSRAWTEKLSNTAHQREVKDLVAAGLNPILSANNGAWSGSGASGQGFSSSGAMASGETASGAMGQTDMSVAGAFTSMVSSMMTTARDLAMTKMNTDAQRYATDKQYAAAKMAAETSIFNNNSNIDANKAIRALDRDADIRKAGISAEATRAAAAANAGAITSAAATNASAARYSADQHLEASKYGSDNSLQGTKYSSDSSLEGTKYKTDRDIKSNPVGYGITMATEGTKELANAFSNLENTYSPDFSNINLLGAD